jgi:hypothetical protein
MYFKHFWTSYVPARTSNFINLKNYHYITVTVDIALKEVCGSWTVRSHEHKEGQWLLVSTSVTYRDLYTTFSTLRHLSFSTYFCLLKIQEWHKTDITFTRKAIHTYTQHNIICVGNSLTAHYCQQSRMKYSYFYIST